VSSAAQNVPDGRDDLLVSFSQSGGFAGVNVRAQIYTNGLVIRTSQRTGTSQSTVAADVIDRLRQALTSADFPRLRRNYSEPGLCDGFIYVVAYQGKTVRSDHTVVPEELRAALSMLHPLARTSEL